MLAISSTIVGSLISSSRTTKCLYCDNYGTEKVSFISDNARVTKRLESTVIDDLERAGSIKDTAARTTLKRDTCKKISEVNRFFKLCGVEGCKQIKAVAMDQNAGFASCVNKHCPNAKVVYDLFHMVYNYARLVISAIRLRLNLSEEKRLKLKDILS